jgi:UDP-N-acetylglucosamine 2-epimerase
MPDGLSRGAPWLVCLGTRPEIVKMAPVVHALRAAGQPVAVLHTGQHDAMAWPLYRFFGIEPDHVLVPDRARDGLSDLAASLLAAIGARFEAQAPRGVLVHGDTLSAMAAATAAFFARVPVGHVEAGLRTFARYDPFPEEKNREVIARYASLHFAPTTLARDNLLREGIAAAAIHLTGNTAVDATRLAVRRLNAAAAGAIDPQVARFLAAHEGHRLVLVTAHRRENWGEGIRRIGAAVARILREHGDVTVLWPVHANPAVARDVAAGLVSLDASSVARLLLTEPLDYPTLIGALRRGWLALTDSGGIQEEAVTLGVPVHVLRETTERPEILAAGCGRLVGTDVDTITRCFDELSANRAAHAAMRCRPEANPFGDGYAAERIATLLGERVPATD